jgi:hypothetical protein
VGNDIAVDASGNVIVAGYTYRGLVGEVYDLGYITLMYNAQGVLVWESVHDGPEAGRWEQATNLTLDTAGNIYVTGKSMGVGKNYDYGTVKYDGGGNKIWADWYDGTGQADDEATDIVVDSQGVVYVTGQSMNYPSIAGNDWATICYNADGTRNWIIRKNGPANSQDRASALALDGAGNLHVTGELITAGSGADLTTIKYGVPYIFVEVDIGGGGDDGSPINLKSRGNVPVAIYSSAEFDATTIDPMSLTFAGTGIRFVASETQPQFALSDLNGDGLLDMMAHFDIQALELSEGDVEGVLEGMTYDGVLFRGVASIRVVV